MSSHFRLRSELSGIIAKRLPHAKNQLSVPCSFFNQFIKDIYIYLHTDIHINRVLIVRIYIQSTPLNRVTSVRGHFAPITRRTLLTENILY